MKASQPVRNADSQSKPGAGWPPTQPCPRIAAQRFRNSGGLHMKADFQTILCLNNMDTYHELSPELYASEIN